MWKAVLTTLAGIGVFLGGVALWSPRAAIVAAGVILVVVGVATDFERDAVATDFERDAGE